MDTKLSATVATIADIKQFLALADTLGYNDHTLVGNHHMGLELFIQLPLRSSVHDCSEVSCKYFTVMESMGLTADRELIMPAHDGPRAGYNCHGAGREGIPRQ